MQNEKIIRERIIKVLNEKGMSMNSIANNDKNLARKIYKQLAEGKTLTYAVIEVIIDKIPDLSTEWLFRGVGAPFEKHVVEDAPSWAIAMEERLMSALSSNEKKVIEHGNNDSEEPVKVTVSIV